MNRVRSLCLMVVALMSMVGVCQATQPTREELGNILRFAYVPSSVSTPYDNFVTRINLVNTTYSNQNSPNPALAAPIGYQCEKWFILAMLYYDFVQRTSYMNSDYDGLHEWIECAYDENDPASYADYLAMLAEIEDTGDNAVARNNTYESLVEELDTIDWAGLQSLYTALGLTW